MPLYKATYNIYRNDKVTTETRAYQANNRLDAERTAKDLVNVLAQSLEARVEFQSVNLDVKKK